MERPARSAVYVDQSPWSESCHIRKEPTVPMSRSISPTILGLDVHKNTISAGILRPGDDIERRGEDLLG